MVKNSRKKTGPSRIRPLNRPAMVRVEEEDDHRPSMVVSHGHRSTVLSIEDVWEIVDEWWRASPVIRRYYRAVVDGDRTITIFLDLASGAWYEQRV